ncbi:MAG: hypothetical protein ACTHM0_15340 [Sphingomonas sp.]
MMVVLTLRERRRQIAIARTRPALDEGAFCSRMEDMGVSNALAQFVWREIQPYYFRPLTPWPSDRIYGDLRIDPDDISDITVRYEEEFSVQLMENPIDCPPDPTLAQWMVALDRASRR